MGDNSTNVTNITDIAEARVARHRRWLPGAIEVAAQRAATAYLAHLEAVARGAPREVVNRRWLMVEERAVAYQELLKLSEEALGNGLDLDLREQIDGEFEADWHERLREECLGPLGGNERVEAALFGACRAAYRGGFGAGVQSARAIGRREDE